MTATVLEVPAPSDPTPNVVPETPTVPSDPVPGPEAPTPPTGPDTPGPVEPQEPQPVGPDVDIPDPRGPETGDR
jgi:hypothetical protein